MSRQLLAFFYFASCFFTQCILIRMFHLYLKKENPHSDTFLHLNEGSLHFYRLFFDWNNSIIALGVVAAVHMVADKWHTVPNIEYVLF